MHHLGHTRSARHATHLLQTPDTFVDAPLPGMRNATAIVHASAAIGAGFTEYTAIFQDQGSLAPATSQRFLYVLEGELNVDGHRIAAGGYAYTPPGSAILPQAKGPARAIVIEKPHAPLDGHPPPTFLTGSERDVKPEPLQGDPALQVRGLIPAQPSFDFAVNTLTFDPGATLPKVEIHVMEHGLLMLEGAGIYRLGEHWHPVAPGDFIWMAPYCPQWFGALGKVQAKYLLYKDWNR